MVNGPLKTNICFIHFVHLSRPHTCFLVSSSWLLLAPLMLSSVSACHRTPSPAAQSRYHRLLHKRLSHSCCVHWTLCRADCWHILTHSVSDIMRIVTLAYYPQPTCNLDHDSKILTSKCCVVLYHSELPGIIHSRSGRGPGHFSLDMVYFSYVRWKLKKVVVLKWKQSPFNITYSQLHTSH